MERVLTQAFAINALAQSVSVLYLADNAGETVANINDNGSNAPGTLLDQCSELSRKRFAKADLIIAKGQANYESLSDSSAPIFFLLQAKCNVIARDLGVTEGGTILNEGR